MEIKKRFYILILAIFLVFMVGSAGYYLLYGGRYTLIDCIFMTVISLTSVGYGEVLEVTGNMPAQVFTIILIMCGMGVILYALSTLTALLIEGKISGIIRKEKMEKKIGKLKNHIIVCGGGDTGRHLLAEFARNHEPSVLIESDEEEIRQCLDFKNLLYIEGDATDDNNLIAAGIEKASGIIVALPSDKDNLYVTMTARMLNQNIRIISRMIDQNLEAKLKKAGADRVVSPNYIGALRMASEMMRPTAVNFLDNMLRSRKGNVRIHDILISEKSSILGKKISTSGLKDKFGLLILGSRYGDSEIKFNPPPDQTLEKGMTLIVMGEVENIVKAREEL